ncbi:hypothetical protein AWB78_08712 [Caballeronia calidae]|uniref:Uncharacterized protein n=1 Tax=Caballeronia calidae TaxID=1777139 RepID=A0A158EP68_9BURK|nr:hypothetical protein AWB78_08712 [Caballeronia calidae]
MCGTFFAVARKRLALSAPNRADRKADCIGLKNGGLGPPTGVVCGVHAVCNGSKTAKIDGSHKKSQQTKKFTARLHQDVCRLCALSRGQLASGGYCCRQAYFVGRHLSAKYREPVRRKGRWPSMMPDLDRELAMKNAIEGLFSSALDPLNARHAARDKVVHRFCAQVCAYLRPRRRGVKLYQR